MGRTDSEISFTAPNMPVGRQASVQELLSPVLGVGDFPSLWLLVEVDTLLGPHRAVEGDNPQARPARGRAGPGVRRVVYLSTTQAHSAFVSKRRSLKLLTQASNLNEPFCTFPQSTYVVTHEDPCACRVQATGLDLPGGREHSHFLSRVAKHMPTHCTI